MKQPRERWDAMLSLSLDAYTYLMDLAATRGYGSNPAEVARTLIEEGIRRALADKIIAVRRNEDKTS